MTTDDRLLIASALDGDLPPAEAGRVRTLLAESVEAAQLYRRLKADRDRLAALPKRKAPASVARVVAERIEPLIVPSGIVRPQRTNGWIPYAIAAAVMVAVGSSILFLSQPDRREVARLPAPEKGSDPFSPEKGSDPFSGAVAAREVLPDPAKPRAPRPGPAIAMRDTPTPAAPKPPAAPDFLTAPAGGGGVSLKTESVRLPFLFAFEEAEQEAVRGRLAEEFTQSPAVRLDAFTRDTAKSLELLVVAARSSGANVTTLPQTAEQVKRKLPVAVAVYFDSLTAKELTALVGRWSKVDAATKSLDRGHLLPAGANESKELKALLGVDVGLGKRSKDEPNQNVAAKTAEQVAAQVGKGTLKPAIAVTFAPAAARVPPGLSPDMKQYLDKRGDRPANAVPTIILLKPVN